MVSLKMKGGKVFCGPFAFFIGCILLIYCATFLCIVAYLKKGIIDINNLSFGPSRLE